MTEEAAIAVVALIEQLCPKNAVVKHIESSHDDKHRVYFKPLDLWHTQSVYFDSPEEVGRWFRKYIHKMSRRIEYA